MPSRPSGAVDPFEKFLQEQSKRPAQWSSNRPLKKPKAADKKETEDMVDLKKQLDEKSAECGALKSQVAELQQTSVSIVEALSKNQETFCKVSITCFLKEIENMYSVFLLSYANTRESLGELEKAVETLACGSCSHSISRSPKLPLVFV